MCGCLLLCGLMKMNFKLTKKKGILSALIVIAVILYARATRVTCEVCEIVPLCVSYSKYLLFKECGCGSCTSIGEVFIQWFMVVVLPVVLVYIIWSLLQKKREMRL